VKFRVKIQVVA